jgi:hypothetical protein
VSQPSAVGLKVSSKVLKVHDLQFTENWPLPSPGFSWHDLKPSYPPNQISRERDEFLWRQAYNAKIARATMLKAAMFDKVNEETAILKAASHGRDAPDQDFG